VFCGPSQPKLSYPGRGKTKEGTAKKGNAFRVALLKVAGFKETNQQRKGKGGGKYDSDHYMSQEGMGTVRISNGSQLIWSQAC